MSLEFEIEAHSVSHDYGPDQARSYLLSITQQSDIELTLPHISDVQVLSTLL
jgi:hypothetical protein